MSAPAPSSSSFKTVNVVLRYNVCVCAELNANDFKDPRVWEWLCSQAKDVKHGDGEIDVPADEFINNDIIENAIDSFIDENAWDFKQNIIDSAVDDAGTFSDSDSDSDSDDELVGHERITALMLGTAEPKFGRDWAADLAQQHNAEARVKSQ